MDKQEILVLSKLNVSTKKYSQLCNLAAGRTFFETIVSGGETVREMLGAALFSKLKIALSPQNVEKIVEELNKLHIKYILCTDSDYPQAFKEVEDFPLVIYYLGDKSLLKSDIITIAGSRKPTSYGIEVAERFSKELSGGGLVVMSGIAYGIDTVVAKAALDAKGKFIAFVAGGLDSIYPEENTELARNIVRGGGLIISTYPPYKASLKFSFLERNRYETLLSRGTVIIEAGKKSGTFAIANFTIENGRELFVVPGNIYSPKSEGSNLLIETYPEVFTISAAKIFMKLGIKYELKQKSAPSKALDSDEVLILGAVACEEKSLDEIAELTKIESKILLRKLTIMEINGLIKKLPGNFYVGIKQD